MSPTPTTPTLSSCDEHDELESEPDLKQQQSPQKTKTKQRPRTRRSNRTVFENASKQQSSKGEAHQRLLLRLREAASARRKAKKTKSDRHRPALSICQHRQEVLARMYHPTSKATPSNVPDKAESAPNPPPTFHDSVRSDGEAVTLTHDYAGDDGYPFASTNTTPMRQTAKDSPVAHNGLPRSPDAISRRLHSTSPTPRTFLAANDSGSQPRSPQTPVSEHVNQAYVTPSHEVQHEPKLLNSTISDLLTSQTSLLESPNTAISVLNQVLASLQSSSGSTPQELYSEWASTYAASHEHEAETVDSTSSRSNLSSGCCWGNKQELNRAIRATVAVKRDTIRTRLAERATLVGLVFPASQFPWHTMRYMLFQQGYQMLNIPDEVPFPGQETLKTGYRGLHGLPTNLCTSWIRCLPSDTSLGVSFQKLEPAAADLMRSGRKPVFVCAPPHPDSLHPNAKQLFITETRMWQDRNGPPRRIEMNQELLGTYEAPAESDTQMDALLMRRSGGVKGVSHLHGNSEEMRALLQKILAARPKAKTSGTFIVSDDSTDDGVSDELDDEGSDEIDDDGFDELDEEGSESHSASSNASVSRQLLPLINTPHPSHLISHPRKSHKQASTSPQDENMPPPPSKKKKTSHRL
ncbi:hypothetical protein AB1N83_013482 [Pleurotus pulmonarius]